MNEESSSNQSNQSIQSKSQSNQAIQSRGLEEGGVSGLIRGCGLGGGMRCSQRSMGTQRAQNFTYSTREREREGISMPKYVIMFFTYMYGLWLAG